MNTEKNPNILPQPANEDNVRWLGYRRSGEGFLKLLLRLEDAAEGRGRIFAVDNSIPGGNPIGYHDGWGEVIDVTYAPVLGETYAKTTAKDIRSALTALAAAPHAFTQAKFLRAIGRIYPPIYLRDEHRELRLLYRFGRLFGVLSERSANIIRFREAEARLARVEAAARSTLLFAYDGFLHLMADLASGRISVKLDESPRLQALKRKVLRIDPAVATSILKSAKRVLTPQERDYNLPDSWNR